jgi:hypothetical protein
MNIQQLPETFIGVGEVKGFAFERVFSNSNAYIYRVTSHKGSKPYYEVFKRKDTPLCIDFKKRIYSDTEFKEIYPKSNAFGVWAWTTFSIGKAFGYVQTKFNN